MRAPQASLAVALGELSLELIVLGAQNFCPNNRRARWLPGRGLQHVRCPKERPCPHTYIEARASSAPPRKPQNALESSGNKQLFLR